MHYCYHVQHLPNNSAIYNPKIGTGRDFCNSCTIRTRGMYFEDCCVCAAELTKAYLFVPIGPIFITACRRHFTYALRHMRHLVICETNNIPTISAFAVRSKRQRLLSG